MAFFTARRPHLALSGPWHVSYKPKWTSIYVVLPLQLLLFWKAWRFYYLCMSGQWQAMPASYAWFPKILAHVEIWKLILIAAFSTRHGLLNIFFYRSHGWRHVVSLWNTGHCVKWLQPEVSGDVVSMSVACVAPSGLYFLEALCPGSSSLSGWTIDPLCHPAAGTQVCFLLWNEDCEVKLCFLPGPSLHRGSSLLLQVVSGKITKNITKPKFTDKVS